ncbi:MAG: hypothetical protein H7210_00395 [Pyrinomonadaceae bacterium]|nr:hypothetical protein [Phycisphaerales bacterium]
MTGRITVARLLLVLCLMFPLLLAAPGCENSTVNKESFDKIQIGMSQYDVEKLLGGSGTEDSAPPGFGVTGGSVATTKDAPPEKTYVWKSDEATIIVVFKEGKVVQKSQK